jgi:pyrimidine-nucleoside phosphorylase
LITVGEKNGLKIKALVTDMNQPLGNAVGNSLEIGQAIEVLKGQGPTDFTALTLELGAEMLVLGKKAGGLKEAGKILQELISTGQALDKFYCLVKAQGGRINQLPAAKHELVIKAPASGYIYSMNTREIGLVATELGAGRQKKEDTIDYSAGIILHQKIGDPIRRGEPLATLYYNKILSSEIKKRLVTAIKIKQSKPVKQPLLYK